MRIWVHDPALSAAQAAEAGVTRIDDWRACLGEVDAVSLHLPLTPQTAGVLDAAAFAAMPRGSYVINVARGGHVIEADLIAAVHSGHLAGAALDVTEPEPLPKDHPLWRAPNVVITPHNSNDSDLGVDAQRRVLVAYWGADKSLPTFEKLREAVAEVARDNPKGDILLIAADYKARPVDGKDLRAMHQSAIVGHWTT